MIKTDKDLLGRGYKTCTWSWPKVLFTHMYTRVHEFNKSREQYALHISYCDMKSRNLDPFHLPAPSTELGPRNLREETLRRSTLWWGGFVPHSLDDLVPVNGWTSDGFMGPGTLRVGLVGVEVKVPNTKGEGTHYKRTTTTYRWLSLVSPSTNDPLHFRHYSVHTFIPGTPILSRSHSRFRTRGGDGTPSRDSSEL